MTVAYCPTCDQAIAGSGTALDVLDRHGQVAHRQRPDVVGGPPTASAQSPNALPRSGGNGILVAIALLAVLAAAFWVAGRMIGTDTSDVHRNASSEIARGLRGAPIPAVAREVPAGPSGATEIAQYEVPPGFDLSEWYQRHAPVGTNLSGWTFCEEGPLLGDGDAGRIYTRPGADGVEVLDIAARGDLGRITILYTEGGLAC